MNTGLLVQIQNDTNYLNRNLTPVRIEQHPYSFLGSKDRSESELTEWFNNDKNKSLFLSLLNDSPFKFDILYNQIFVENVLKCEGMRMHIQANYDIISLFAFSKVAMHFIVNEISDFINYKTPMEAFSNFKTSKKAILNSVSAIDKLRNESNETSDPEDLSDGKFYIIVSVEKQEEPGSIRIDEDKDVDLSEIYQWVNVFQPVYNKVEGSDVKIKYLSFE